MGSLIPGLFSVIVSIGLSAYASWKEKAWHRFEYCVIGGWIVCTFILGLLSPRFGWASAILLPLVMLIIEQVAIISMRS